jgi:hypothetical protein
VVSAGVQRPPGPVLGDPALKGQKLCSGWYTSINPQVKPLDNISARPSCTATTAGPPRRRVRRWRHRRLLLMIPG